MSRTGPAWYFLPENWFRLSPYLFWKWGCMGMPKSMTRLMATVATVLVCVVYGQNASDLIDGVQEAAINGSAVDQFFTPSIRVNQKSKIDHLQTQGFLTFQIADYTLKDLRLEDAKHASLPVTVKWSTCGEEASKTTTLRFVKEQDKWYFAQADFLGSIGPVVLLSDDRHSDRVCM
jgi:hypothetical protein